MKSMESSEMPVVFSLRAERRRRSCGNGSCGATPSCQQPLVRRRTCRALGGRLEHQSAASAAPRMRCIFMAAALVALHVAHASAPPVPRALSATGGVPAPTPWPRLHDLRQGPAACPDPPCGWLVPGAWAGLTNQLYCIYNALAAAERLHVGMVLPMLPTAYADGGEGKMLAFNHLYDEDFFISEVRRLKGLIVSRQLPEQLVPRCIAQLQMQADKYAPEPQGCSLNYLNDLRRWLAEHRVACLQSFCTFARLEDQHHYHEWRPAVHPSALYEAEADAVVALLQARYNTTSFVAVHARVEQDFQKGCSNEGENEVFGGKGTHLHHKCFVTEAEIADHLDKMVAKGHLDPGALLFVASGAPLEALPTLCAQGEGSSGRYRCVKREMLKPQLGEGIPSTLLTRAYLDFVVARRAQAFVGNTYSTFSRELEGVFKQLLHRRADFYNPSVADERARIAARRPNPPPPPS